VHPGGGEQVGVDLLDVRGVEPGLRLREGGDVVGLEREAGLERAVHACRALLQQPVVRVAWTVASVKSPVALPAVGSVTS
jgi:hypothetical protein